MGVASTAILSQTTVSLVETSPTLMLSGDNTGDSQGVFKGMIREARLWDTVLPDFNISNTDCTSYSPVLWFKWAEVASTGDGCPNAGDYCQTWLSTPLCANSGD